MATASYKTKTDGPKASKVILEQRISKIKAMVERIEARNRDGQSARDLYAALKKEELLVEVSPPKGETNGGFKIYGIGVRTNRDLNMVFDNWCNNARRFLLQRA